MITHATTYYRHGIPAWKATRRRTLGPNNMSLVMAFCLSNKDVLFASDRVYVVRDEAGNVVSRYANCEKWLPYSGGMIGFAGEPGIARDIIDGLPPITRDTPSRGLRIAEYLREGMASFSAFGERVEFIFSDGPDCLYSFASDVQFTPAREMGFAAIGVTDYARFIHFLHAGDLALTLTQTQRLAILQLLVTSEKIAEIPFLQREALRSAAGDCPFEKAKRLAAFQIAAAADANPTAVSHELDMWVLRHGATAPEKVPQAEVDRIRAEVHEYRRKSLESLYNPSAMSG